MYKDGAGPSQSAPQPSTIVQITQQVRAELRDELREELREDMRAELFTHLQQQRAEMMAFVSQGASVDPNRQVRCKLNCLIIKFSHNIYIIKFKYDCHIMYGLS